MERLDYTFQTEQGLTVTVRPLGPEDAHHLVELFKAPGARSRLQRYWPPLANLTPRRLWQEALRVAHVSLPEEFGLLAFGTLPEGGDAPVAVVRYRRVPPDEAEVDLSVREEVQGNGIGTYLLKLIAAHARANGIRRLFALMLEDSRFLYHLLQYSPFPITHIPQGEYAYIAADLDLP